MNILATCCGPCFGWETLVEEPEDATGRPQVKLDALNMGLDAVIVKNGTRVCGTGAVLGTAAIMQDKAYFEVKVQSDGIWGCGVAAEQCDLNKVPTVDKSWVLTSENTIQKRRVASLTVTDAPRRVTRWLGRKSGVMRRGTTPTKQTFWELKLGMPGSLAAEAQEEGTALGPHIERLDMPSIVSAAEAQAIVSQRTAREDAREEERQKKWLLRQQQQGSGSAACGSSASADGGPIPLVLRTSATVNAPPESIASAKKLTDRKASDLAEEERIKRSTPRRRSANVGESPALPSPRRALFLAPSPRRALEQKQSLLAAEAPQSENHAYEMGA